MIDGEPLLLQFAGERDQRLDGPPQRVEVRDLGSDVAVQANDLETRAPVHLQADFSRVAEGDAELVGLEPGGNMRMAARVDVGVHPHRDPGARPPRHGQRVDALQFSLRFGVDAANGQVDGVSELGVGLADPGEHDLGGGEPGAESDVDLTAGIGVSEGAEPAQKPDDAQHRIRLQRVVQRVRVAGERVVHGAVTFGDCGGTVNVKRSSVSGHEIGERHALTVKRATGTVEWKQCESIVPCRHVSR